MVVGDSLAEQNNLKITWNYYWVVSICGYLSRYFLQVQTNYFFILDDNCTHPMCTSPTEYKVKTCKEQDKSPHDFRTDSNRSGWEGITQWKDLFQQQRSRQRGNVWARPQQKQWEDHHHQYSWRDTCTVKLHISMCKNGWGLWISSPEKNSEKHLHGIQKVWALKRGKKLFKKQLKRQGKKIWHWIQHVARWMRLQAKPDSPLLSENQEGI